MRILGNPNANKKKCLAAMTAGHPTNGIRDGVPGKKEEINDLIVVDPTLLSWRNPFQMRTDVVVSL